MKNFFRNFIFLIANGIIQTQTIFKINKVYRFLIIMIAVCLCGKWCYLFLFFITEEFLKVSFRTNSVNF